MKLGIPFYHSSLVLVTAVARSPRLRYPSANDAMNEVIGDAFFVCPARRTARRAEGAGADVYLYSFAHVAEQPLIPDLGSFHASELSFVFGIDAPLAPVTPNEAPLRDAMMGYWTRFANTGDPNGGTAPTWPKYATASDPNMKLDLPEPTAESALKSAKCDFWDGLLP